jgi:hypothetical protein
MQYGRDWRSLIFAGSNSGANAVYRAKMTKSLGTHIIGSGAGDVRNDADWTRNRAQKFGNSWRASSKVGETCGWPGGPSRRFNYELVRSGERV